MKYLKTVLALFLLAVPGLIWYRQTGDLTFYFAEQVPEGQLLYVLSKLAGLYALVFIAWQIFAALSERVITLPAVKRNRLHRWLGSLVIILALAHLVLFFLAVSMRQDAPALSLFLPSFKDYYHTRLAFGLFALWFGRAGRCSAGWGEDVGADSRQWHHRAFWGPAPSG